MRVVNYDGFLDNMISAGTDVFEQAGQTAMQSLQSEITSTLTNLIPVTPAIETVETINPVIETAQLPQVIEVQNREIFSSQAPQAGESKDMISELLPLAMLFFI